MAAETSREQQQQQKQQDSDVEEEVCCASGSGCTVEDGCPEEEEKESASLENVFPRMTVWFEDEIKPLPEGADECIAVFIQPFLQE